MTFKKCTIGCLALLSLFSAAFSHAVTKPTSKAPDAYPDWRGFYLGAITGHTAAKYNTKTSTQAGSLLTSSQANTVNNAGNQELTPGGFIAGIEGGYNWQHKRFLFGMEADAQSLSLNATTNTGAITYPSMPGTRFVLTTYGNSNWLFTARPKLGFVTDAGVLYITGGLGLTLMQNDFIFSDNGGNFESKRVDQYKWGYMAGAGFETGLTEHTSLKLEYLLAYFNKTNAQNMNNFIPSGQTFSNSADLRMNMLRIGFNYYPDQKNNGALFPQLIPMLTEPNDWTVEVGAQTFFSTGSIGSPNPLLNTGGILASRLIFSDLNAITLETQGRIDHKSGLFLKGFLGSGNVTNGQLNDEDFPGEDVYSNTKSQSSGNISYANIDIGYSPFVTETANTGIFLGYNYNAQNINAYSCRQLAGDSVCVPSSELEDFLGISEDDHYKSMRVGLASRFNMSNSLSLSSEAAYLPYVNVNGQDNHNARQLIGPEQSTVGDGAMLETLLSYKLNSTWNIGLGARYWMWNMHEGEVIFDFLGESDNDSTEPGRYNTYRYGVFLQLNYTGEKTPSSYLSSEPFNWQGFFIGAQLGGAWGTNKWSDPFSSTFVGDNENVAGFGDKIHVTGPLGGLSLNYNHQINHWVVGVAAKANVMDIRGEDTLFSGLGGVNGETVSNQMLAITARAGTVYNRTLFYLNAGPAMLNTNYRINANTSALSLGSQNKTASNWGAMLGVGVEHAISDRWTTSVEYNYLRISNISLSYPDISTINGHRYSVSQTMSFFNVGINYKFV